MVGVAFNLITRDIIWHTKVIAKKPCRGDPDLKKCRKTIYEKNPLASKNLTMILSSWFYGSVRLHEILFIL